MGIAAIIAAIATPCGAVEGFARRGDGGGKAVIAMAFRGGAVADRRGTVATVGMPPPPLRAIAGDSAGGTWVGGAGIMVELALVPIKRLCVAPAADTDGRSLGDGNDSILARHLWE